MTPVAPHFLKKPFAMRILYSAFENYPPRRPDIVTLFFTELAARGVECTWYLSNRFQRHPDSNTFMGQRIRVAPAFPISGFLGMLINRMAYWLGDIPFMVMGARAADIVQVRDKYFAAGLALFVTRLTGKKAVYWCSYPYPEHSNELADLETNLVRSVLRRVYSKIAHAWLYGFIMPRMDHVFVQSDQMLTDINSYGVPKEKMTAVPMGVPRSLLEPAHPAKDVPVIPNRIVYLGSLGRARRLEMLIDAFALVALQVPGASFIMVGGGDAPSDCANLEDYIRFCGIESRVEITGLLPTNAAWLRVGEAAVCVSPIYPSLTLRQGSPTKLYEYMALGKPTVANDHPEQSKVLAESDAGLCVPWDAVAFAGAICKLLADPARATAMAARGPVWVAANRTYDSLADLVFAKYKVIVDSNLGDLDHA